MKNTKTRILTVLLVIAVSFTVLSLGSVSVYAGIPEEYDQHGIPISYWVPTLAGKLEEKLWIDDLPNESSYGTYIFLDSQLVAYNLIEALCDMYPAQTDEGVEGVARLFYAYGIQIFVHMSDWTFANITMQEMGYEQYVFDFSDQSTYNWLYSQVGQVAMCGMAILNMDYSLYSFLLHFQDVWQYLCQKSMPIYTIQRDLISYGVDGLEVYICNLYAPSAAGGGTTGGQVQIVPGE